MGLCHSSKISRSIYVISLRSKLLQSHWYMCDFPRFYRLSSPLSIKFVLYNNMLIYISYLRRVLALGYKNPSIIKPFKRYRALRARNTNNKSRKKRREPCSCVIEKRRRNDEILSFTNSPQKDKKEEYSP